MLSAAMLLAGVMLKTAAADELTRTATIDATRNTLPIMMPFSNWAFGLPSTFQAISGRFDPGQSTWNVAIPQRAEWDGTRSPPIRRYPRRRRHRWVTQPGKE